MSWSLMRIDLGRKSKAAVDVKYLYRRTVNVVDVSYLISFAEGKHRDKERQNFRFLRGRNSSLDRRSACFLMKGPPAKAQSFATVLLWLQEPQLYRLAEAIIGACKKREGRVARTGHGGVCRNYTLAYRNYVCW